MTLLQEQIQRMRILSGLSESVTLNHFDDRINDRLNSPYTTFSQGKPEIRDVVMRRIQQLRGINFPGQLNIGVRLFKGSTDYVYHKVIGGKVEHSEGPIIWAVLRANELETLVFGKANYLPRNTQHHYTIEQLTKYMGMAGNRNLNEKDIRKLDNRIAPSAPAQNVKPTEETFVGNGVKWLFDAATQELYQKNNPAKRMPAYDALEMLEPASADRLLNSLA